jgi:hypothetical protein
LTKISFAWMETCGVRMSSWPIRPATLSTTDATSVTISVLVDAFELMAPRSDFSGVSVATSSATGT